MHDLQLDPLVALVEMGGDAVQRAGDRPDAQGHAHIYRLALTAKRGLQRQVQRPGPEIPERHLDHRQRHAVGPPRREQAVQRIRMGKALADEAGQDGL